MNILVFGETTYCVTSLLKGFPIENSKYEVMEKYESGGGSAATIAYLLGSWNVNTSLATIIGSDDFASKIKKELQTVNVKLDYLETNFEKNTSSEFIIVNTLNGSNTDFILDNSLGHLKKNTWIEEFNYIVTDGYEYQASSMAYQKYSTAKKILFGDTVTPEKLDLLKSSNYLVCSSIFAETIAKMKMDLNDSTSLVRVYNDLLSKYPECNIVISLGSNGCLYSINGNIRIMPGLKVEVKDSSFASEIFAGSLVYGLTMNYDLEKCLTLANIALGLSIQKYGSRASIPDLNSVLTYYTEKFATNNNPSNNVPVPPVNSNMPPIPNQSAQNNVVVESTNQALPSIQNTTPQNNNVQNVTK